MATRAIQIIFISFMVVLSLTGKCFSQYEDGMQNGTPDYLKGELKQTLNGAKEMPYKVYSIYELDVIGYYGLAHEYDTDLKKKMYMKTTDYQSKLSELTRIKEEMLSSQQYTMIDSPLSDYDINKNGFDLFIGRNVGQGTIMARAPKSINGIYFPSLPTKNQPFPEMGEGVFGEHLFLPISEEMGLAVENNKENIRIFLIFGIDGMKSVQYKYLCITYGWYNMKHDILTTKSVRLVVANISTGEVYYSKVY